MHMHSIERQRLDHGAEHLHRLGARATADFLTELAGTIGGQPAIMRLLAEYQNRPARRTSHSLIGQQRASA